MVRGRVAYHAKGIATAAWEFFQAAIIILAVGFAALGALLGLIWCLMQLPFAVGMLIFLVLLAIFAGVLMHIQNEHHKKHLEQQIKDHRDE